MVCGLAFKFSQSISNLLTPQGHVHCPAPGCAHEAIIAGRIPDQTEPFVAVPELTPLDLCEAQLTIREVSQKELRACVHGNSI